MNERGRLQRQEFLSKEVRKLVIVNKELMRVISEYEAKYGDVVINGNRVITLLKEEQQSRNVKNSFSL